jgi:hypothetical protein
MAKDVCRDTQASHNVAGNTVITSITSQVKPDSKKHTGTEPSSVGMEAEELSTSQEKSSS